MEAFEELVKGHFRQLERKRYGDRAKANYAEYVDRRGEEELYRLHPFNYLHLNDERFSYREPKNWSWDYTFFELREGVARSFKTWDFAIDRLRQLNFHA